MHDPFLPADEGRLRDKRGLREQDGLFDIRCAARYRQDHPAHAQTVEAAGTVNHKRINNNIDY